MLNLVVKPILVLFILANSALTFSFELNKGLKIAKKSNELYSGYGNSRAHLRMILSNKSGNLSERSLTMSMLEKSDGNLSLIIFNTPSDIKGTSLLTHGFGSGDKQWLYLPSLKRVKRISGAKKSSAFLGSEFSFEDLSSMEIDKYRYEYLRKETTKTGGGHVIDRIPKDTNSRYQKLTTWYDANNYLPLKIEFFDKKGWHIKTLTFLEYKSYIKRSVWRASEMLMVNLITGKSTLLVLDDIKFDIGLTKQYFHPQKLKDAK